MSYDDEFYDDEQYHEPELPVLPPENMKLTIEVGLTEYSPQGLLELIARALLKEIGGRDKWSARLIKQLSKIAEEQAQALVQKEISEIWAGTSEVDFRSIVQTAARDYMTEKVDSQGRTIKSTYNEDKHESRLQWIIAKLTKEAMDAAFKEAEKEWKEQTKTAIRETLAEVLATRLAKALPSPPELR